MVRSCVRIYRIHGFYHIDMPRITCFLRLEKLKRAWKSVLFNQFYDIWGGCSRKGTAVNRFKIVLLQSLRFAFSLLIFFPFHKPPLKSCGTTDGVGLDGS